MKVSADKKTASIRIDAELSAAQVQTLIADLAKLRAGMEPPVPFEPTEDEAANISEQSKPYWQAFLLGDGGVRFWFRNAGLGWMAFKVSADEARAVRDFLSSGITGKPVASLFGDENGQGGASQ